MNNQPSSSLVPSDPSLTRFFFFSVFLYLARPDSQLSVRNRFSPTAARLSCREPSYPLTSHSRPLLSHLPSTVSVLYGRLSPPVASPATLCCRRPLASRPPSQPGRGHGSRCHQDTAAFLFRSPRLSYVGVRVCVRVERGFSYACVRADVRSCVCR